MLYEVITDFDPFAFQISHHFLMVFGIYTSNQNPSRVINISMQVAFAKDHLKIATSPQIGSEAGYYQLF